MACKQSGSTLMSPWGAAFPASNQWEFDRHRGPFPRTVALGTDGAAMRVYRGLGDRQAEAQPAEFTGHRTAPLLKRIENAPQCLRCDADAIVGHFDHDPVVRIARLDRDSPPFRRKL